MRAALLASIVFTFVVPSAWSEPILASGSYGGSDYVVVGDTGATWDQANAAAQALGPGWHLVTITSAGEQAYLVSMLNAANLGSGQLWAGGVQIPSDSAPGANWTWANGETWSFTAWANDSNAQEPNDDFGPGSESYLTLDNRWSRDWTWNDETVDSRDRLGFVAERTSVPEPTTMVLFGVLTCGAGLAYRRRRVA